MSNDAHTTQAGTEREKTTQAPEPRPTSRAEDKQIAPNATLLSESDLESVAGGGGKGGIGGDLHY